MFNLQNVRYTCNLPWHTWLVLDMDHGEKDYGKPSNFVFHYKCAWAQLLRFSTNILYLLGTSHLFFRSEFSKDLIFWLWLTVCTLLVFKRAPEFSMNSDWKRKWHHNFQNFWKNSCSKRREHWYFSRISRVLMVIPEYR